MLSLESSTRCSSCTSSNDKADNRHYIDYICYCICLEDIFYLLQDLINIPLLTIINTLQYMLHPWNKDRYSQVLFILIGMWVPFLVFFQEVKYSKHALYIGMFLSPVKVLTMILKFLLNLLRFCGYASMTSFNVSNKRFHSHAIPFFEA